MTTDDVPIPRRSAVRSLLLIVILLGGAVGLAGFLFAMRVEPPRMDDVPPPPVVDAVVLKRDDIKEEFIGYGAVEAMRVAQIASEVAATVTERVGLIRRGSPVHVDQILVRLDDRTYRTALRQAQAELAAEEAALSQLDVEAQELARLILTTQKELHIAKNERDRVVGLFERSLAAEKERNVATLAYQRARRTLQAYQRELASIAPRRRVARSSVQGRQAAVERARLDVERCAIRAPFAGQLSSLDVDVGDLVAPGSPVATVIDATSVEVAIHLPASAYDRVAPGAACRLECEGMRGVVWRGGLARRAPDVDSQTRTFAAYVVVDNRAQPQPLVPGIFVEAVVEGATYADSIIVPRGAIRNDRVLVVVGGRIAQRSVRLSRIIGDRAVVAGPLDSGDIVVLSLLSELSEGDPVRLPEWIRSSESERPGISEAVER